MYLWSRKNLLNFESHLPLDPDTGIFKQDSSTLQDRVFFNNLAYISRGSNQIFTQILSLTYPWTRKSPLNLSGNRDTDSRSRPDWHAVSNCSCFYSIMSHTSFLWGGLTPSAEATPIWPMAKNL